MTDSTTHARPRNQSSSAATPARTCAFAVVRRVFERGAYADVAFRAEAERHELDSRERAFAMRLAYGTIQRRGTLDYLIERLTRRPLSKLDPPVLASLRMGMYQVLYLDGVADHAAVDESVELVKAARSRGHGLVNATLRRATGEARSLVELLGEDTAAQAALRHSHPLWVAELWWRTLGREQAVALMRQDNEPPESAVRANTLRTSADDLVAAFAEEGVRARTDQLAPEAIVLEDPYDVHGSALFERGELMPQARASMLVAHVLDPRPGHSVLDLCAAPGAKTTHIAALMGDEGRVLAVDLDGRRARALTANCERLGVSTVETRVEDARDAERLGAYDRVLVDPPCSDLGTLQSRPDVRWRKRPEDVQSLRGLQAEILQAAAAAVRPGGRLVYSTCTISDAENEAQASKFLALQPGFSPVDLSESYPDELLAEGGGAIRTLPHRDRTDGFFIAAFQRTS
jgi:16S rRNA (cytosine967-C5)-methyltransferase